MDLETYTVVKVENEAPGVSTLTLQNKKEGVVFMPGQYINVFFPDTGTPEGKAYSISSTPNQSTIDITVRDIGLFSHRLCSMHVGDCISGSKPYGFFMPEYTDSDLVLLAAGIGVTPFKSIISDALIQNPNRYIVLLHSIRTCSDAVFGKYLEQLSKRYPNFLVQYFITQDEATDGVYNSIAKRRIKTEDVLSNIRKDTRVEVLMCGSIPFTRDMWRMLKMAGVSEDSMYTEAFFSH